MAFSYPAEVHGRGKSTDKAEFFTGRFTELIPNEKLVEMVEVESDDPAFAGIMTITTTLVPVSDGTKVTFTAENVPPGISAEDHRSGMQSSLKNLANFIE